MLCHNSYDSSILRTEEISYNCHTTFPEQTQEIMVTVEFRNASMVLYSFRLWLFEPRL